MDFNFIPEEVKCQQMADLHYDLFEKFGMADIEPSVQMIRAWVKLVENSSLVDVEKN